jgi:carbonic anhydrase/mannitol/fructose-specific phosphotransferase system IIA component (Ntr-type)
MKFAEGAINFQTQRFPKLARLFGELASGQNPEALFITCSDSRISPSLLTQAKPGDLFIVRNAGNIVQLGEQDAGFAGSLEYAVKVLEVDHIVVCGHSHCGAVSALVEEQDLSALPDVGRWVETSRPIIERLEQKNVGADERIERAIEENVRLQLERLAEIPYVKERMAKGSLELHGWVYRLESGDVVVLDGKTDQFIPLPVTQKIRRQRSEEFVSESDVLLDAEADSFEEICEVALSKLVETGAIAADAKAELTELLRAREQVASTAIGQGVACPHVSSECLDQPHTVFLRLKRPLDLGAPDGVDSDLVFLLLGVSGREREHVETLSKLASLVSDDAARAGLKKSSTAAAVLDELRDHRTRAKADKKAGERLATAGIEQRTGRFCGGLIDDIKRRLPLYGSDFRDGLNLKTIAASIFMFFACLTAAITFGTVMDAGTGGAIGVVEMILATALCGVVFSLFAGQPLIILGGTGPLLIFTAVLYDFCASRPDLPFLPFYAWVGIWSGLFTVILALTDASVLIRKLTRFTDEIFVLLIAVIFIYKAVGLLIAEFQSDAALSYATAMSAMVLALGTFAIVIGLRAVRQSGLLRASARNFLADFGAAIAIVTMSAIGFFMRDSSNLPHVELPATVSYNPADYLVDIFALPPAWIAGAMLPALFACILIFLDEQITARVVNAPQHHLKKGPGYHLDLVIVGVLITLCSVFRLPWLVAATVRSLNHVNALSTTHPQSEVGKTSEVTDAVVENRVSGLLIHILIGSSIAFAGLLSYVPQACLYGIFLYMGIVSLGGIQFFERVTLWVRDPKRYPRTHYLRKVSTRSVHIFTLIQLVCFGLLWAVKSGPPTIALLFPVVLMAMVPVRWFIGRFFSDEELEALDGEETPEDEAEWAL